MTEVFKMPNGRTVSVDGHRINYGHTDNFLSIESEIIKLIIADIIIGRTKYDTLKTVFDLYDENWELYAEGILTGMAVAKPRHKAGFIWKQGNVTDAGTCPNV